MKKTLLVLLASALSPLAMQAQQSRLTAIVDLYCEGPDYVPTDSTILSYTGARGGDLTHTLKYDSYLEMTASSGSYVNSFTQTQTFDANNNILTYLQQVYMGDSLVNYFQDSNTYDTRNNLLTTFAQTFNTTTNSWDNYTNEIRTYDAHNNLLTDGLQYLDGYTVNNSNVINTYDAGNNLLTNTTQGWNSTTAAWVNASKSIYTYDGSNNVLTTTTQNWDLTSSAWVNASSYAYTYNTANKVAGVQKQFWDNVALAWVESDSSVNTYDAGDNLIYALSNTWDTSALKWYGSVQVTSTYDGSHDLLTQVTQYWDVSDGVWENSDQNTIYSDYVDGHPQVMIQQISAIVPDTFINNIKYVYTYNSEGQETSAYTTAWWEGDWMALEGNQGARYYYGNYTTVVNNISNNNCTASVYPVPAKTMLHVSVSWDVPQAFNIQIISMDGRVASQWSIPETKSYDGNITISNLAEGNYIMKIAGSDAQSVEHIVITK